jgi:hypothetical protein
MSKVEKNEIIKYFNFIWESEKNLGVQVLLAFLTLCEIFRGSLPPLLNKLIF